jgi:hypothetical protein
LSLFWEIPTDDNTKTEGVKALEIGDMDNLKGLDPVIFYSMSKLVSLKVSFLDYLALSIFILENSNR